MRLMFYIDRSKKPWSNFQMLINIQPGQKNNMMMDEPLWLALLSMAFAADAEIKMEFEIHLQMASQKWSQVQIEKRLSQRQQIEERISFRLLSDLSSSQPRNQQNGKTAVPWKEDNRFILYNRLGDVDKSEIIETRGRPAKMCSKNSILKLDWENVLWETSAKVWWVEASVQLSGQRLR